MKKTVILLVMPFILITSCESLERAPVKVRNSFTARYADAKKVSWSEEDEVWEAEFMLNNVEMSASYTEEGEWTETETDIALESLEAQIIDSIKVNFPACRILKAEAVEKPGVLAHELLIEQNGIKKEVLITSDFQLSAKEVSDNEDND